VKMSENQSRIVSLCVICLKERIARGVADGHVSNVRGPYLVRPVDPQDARQLRKYPVPGRRLVRPRLRSQCRDAHEAHQPLDPLRLTARPSPRSIRDIRREPKKGHAVNSSSI
jgi:hypothetical protein